VTPPAIEAQILRYYHVEKWPVGTIAAQLHIHHGVVQRVLAQAGLPRIGAPPRRSKIDAYLPFITRTLETFPKLTASRLYAMVRERGYPGRPDHFRHLIARHRPRPKAEAYLRLRTLPGEQAQVDWGHFGHLEIGRARRPLMAFVMVLSHSRQIFLRFFLDARMDSFLRGHAEACAAFNGCARVVLYDNLKSAVLERQGDAGFVIGLRLLEIASLAPRGHGLRQMALPYMEDLHVATRQHVLLAVRDGSEAVLVERLSARGAGRVLYRVGGRMPLHATGVGLCLLANANTDVQNQALAGDLTLVPENRRLSPSELRATLAAVRRDGVAVASRPAPSPMTSVAAPIFGRGNEAIAALSVLTPSADVDPVALIPAVTAVCRSISRAMRRD